LPQRHHADREGNGAVVYYQARTIRLHAERQVDIPAYQDPAFFDKVDSVANATSGSGSTRTTSSSSRSWNATTELGVKFRTRVEGRQRILSLGYQFSGVRLGIRYSGFKTVKLTRMIVEVGPGVW